MITFTIPGLRLEGANVREHWTKRHKRAALQRSQACIVARAFVHAVKLPVVVTIVRLGRGILDDDNAVYACKFTRDGLADALGIDDRDPRVTWRVRQERAKAWAVRVVIEPAAPQADTETGDLVVWDTRSRSRPLPRKREAQSDALHALQCRTWADA